MNKQGSMMGWRQDSYHRHVQDCFLWGDFFLRGGGGAE